MTKKDIMTGICMLVLYGEDYMEDFSENGKIIERVASAFDLDIPDIVAVKSKIRQILNDMVLYDKTIEEGIDKHAKEFFEHNTQTKEEIMWGTFKRIEPNLKAQKELSLDIISAIEGGGKEIDPLLRRSISEYEADKINQYVVDIFDHYYPLKSITQWYIYGNSIDFIGVEMAEMKTRYIQSILTTRSRNTSMYPTKLKVMDPVDKKVIGAEEIWVKSHFLDKTGLIYLHEPWVQIATSNIGKTHLYEDGKELYRSNVKYSKRKDGVWEKHYITGDVKTISERDIYMLGIEGDLRQRIIEREDQSQNAAKMAWGKELGKMSHEIETKKEYLPQEEHAIKSVMGDIHQYRVRKMLMKV